MLIETFKMLKGVNNIDYRHLFTFSNNRTRSNGWKLELKNRKKETKHTDARVITSPYTNPRNRFPDRKRARRAALPKRGETAKHAEQIRVGPEKAKL